MKPGYKTTEFWVTVLKIVITAAIALCTTFGVGTPPWLRPDAAWISAAAMGIGGAVSVAYVAQRYLVKRRGVIPPPPARSTANV